MAVALKFEGSGTHPATQRVTISKNTRYELSVWIRVEPSSKGAVVFDTGDRFDDTCQFVISSDVGGEWVHKTGLFDSGDFDNLELRCFTSGDFSGTCYWNQILLKNVAVHSQGDGHDK